MPTGKCMLYWNQTCSHNHLKVMEKCFRKKGDQAHYKLNLGLIWLSTCWWLGCICKKLIRFSPCLHENTYQTTNDDSNQNPGPLSCDPRHHAKIKLMLGTHKTLVVILPSTSPRTNPHPHHRYPTQIQTHVHTLELSHHRPRYK